MNRITQASLLATLLVLGAVGVAAQDAVPPQSSNSMRAFQADQNAADAAAKSKQKVPAPGDRACIQSTGSLIPAKPGHCLPVAGRSYGRQDIQNTGEPTLGPALEKLDPSVTVRGH